MKLVSIKFNALPTSKQISQDFGMHMSTVCIKEQAEEHQDLTIIGVWVDGLSQWSVPVDPTTVAIRPPLRQQGERVEVRCVALDSSPKALHWPAPANPLPDDSYGLQAPAARAMGTGQRGGQ